MTFGTILTAIGWVLALAFTWITGSALAVAGRHVAETRRRSGKWRLWNAPGWPGVPLTYGCAALSAFTALGVLPVLAGAALAALTAAVLLVPLARVWLMAARRGEGGRVARRILRGLAGNVRVGARYPWWDIRALLERLRGEDEPAAAPPPRPAPASPRTVPAAVSVRNDPDLGDAPTTGQVAGALIMEGVPVPAHWAALCEEVGSFEPDTDEDLIGHVAGEAAGVLAYADAVRNRAETLLHGTGLDPAYVAGHLEFADEFGDLAAAAAMVNKRFHAIYTTLREWVAEHPEGMPYKAREWLQGGGPGARDEDEAA